MLAPCFVRRATKHLLGGLLVGCFIKQGGVAQLHAVRAGASAGSPAARCPHAPPPPPFGM